MGDLARLTVLVVEDYEDTRFMMRCMLEMGGFRVIEASDGQEAIELARSTRPDFILMDLSLPKVDGLTATREIRKTEALERVPVLALTAHVQEEYREQALAAGCNEFLSKPVDFAVLESLLMTQASLQRGSSISQTIH
jgi:CheY-like chemotaxis protein